MQEDRLIQNLTRYYQTHRTDLTRPEIILNWVNNTGWESEIYGYTLTFGPPDQRLSVTRVLRLMTGGGLDDARGEYRTLSLLHQSGFPVPEVYAVGSAVDGLERPFIIMQRIEGGSFAARFPRQPGEDQGPLVDFIALFRRLHTLHWPPFADHHGKLALSDNPHFHFDRTVAMHASYLSKPPLSDFQIVIRWLESRRDLVPCERNAPVHQDFHPDNILEDQDGKLYVIDWTNFEISDYRFDLAWTLTLAYAHGGAWRRKIILDEYENQMGQSVPHIEVFEVDAILRRIGSIMLSLTNGADSMGMRPETASLMRQQREPVHRLYERLQQLTSLRVQAVEDLLEGWA